ncbi:asparagine synthase (glutamine-hydrolyzing) [soil metagenome]
MCGIAGAINFKLDQPNILERMGHRGPDEHQGYQSHNVDFFHLRLSILDIAGGKQPMNLGNRFTIIFNGQIYNHNKIRQQFGLKGNTSSDTETLLLLYEKFGTDFLQYLDGMFVFAIHDKQKNILFVARDRAGKKPLYYYNDGKKLVFASELNCLKGMLPLELEPQHFYEYLRLGSFYRSHTPYKNVTELPAGTFLTIDCTSLIINEKKWWNVHDQYLKTNDDDLPTALNKTDEYLHLAVKRRLESSDLEVGCFLSGGIDSGLVTAIASEYNKALKTFTVSFEGEYNEAPLAKLVADKYNTHHTEIKISFDHLTNDLEKIISNYGEPFFDSSAIPSYYVSREAKKHLTVILNGDGADELFAGYRRYVLFSKYDFFKRNSLLKNTAAALRNILPYSDNKKSKYNYLYRMLSLASKSDLEIYLSAGVDIFEDFESHIINNGADPLEHIKNDFKKISDSSISGLKKIMNMDFDTNLFGDLLVKMDIATMANSLEGRSPFLSKELLEYAPSLKDKLKINGTTTKFLLRQLAKKYLPEELVNQPKRGFEIPLKKWMDNELKQMTNDYISSSTALYKNFIETDFVIDLLHNRIKVPAEKRAKILYTLLSMEIWYNKVYKA